MSSAGFAPPEEIVERLRAARNPVLFCHIYPDGDAVGSELGLFHGLKALGASPSILNTHPAPEKFDFLDPDRVVEVVDEHPNDAQIARIQAADLLVILDTSDPERLGRLSEAVFASPAPRLVVDHHLCRHRDAFDYLWSETSSPATGNLVLSILETMQVEITKEIADPLMVALGTDTGWFKFSNSSPEAFRVASRLVAAGGDPEALFGAVFETSSAVRIQLLGEVLAGLRCDCGERIVHATLTRELLERYQVGYEETDGFIDSLKMVGGAEILFMLVELSPGRYKVSLRSKGPVEIHTIAERFGGGGHAKAAGCRFEGTEDEVRDKVLTAAREVLGL